MLKQFMKDERKVMQKVGENPVSLQQQIQFKMCD